MFFSYLEKFQIFKFIYTLYAEKAHAKQHWELFKKMPGAMIETVPEERGFYCSAVN